MRADRCREGAFFVPLVTMSAWSAVAVVIGTLLLLALGFALLWPKFAGSSASRPRAAPAPAEKVVEPLLTGEPVLPNTPAITIVQHGEDLAFFEDFVYITEPDSEYAKKGHFVCLNGASYRIEYFSNGSPTKVVLDRRLEKAARPGDTLRIGQCDAKPWAKPEVFVNTADPELVTAVSNDSTIRSRGYEAGISHIGVAVSDSPKLSAGDAICIENFYEYRIDQITPHSPEIDLVHLNRALDETVPVGTPIRRGGCS